MTSQTHPNPNERKQFPTETIFSKMLGSIF